MNADEFIRIRKSLGLNQSELGRELDFTQPYVSEIERGLRPHPTAVGWTADDGAGDALPGASAGWGSGRQSLKGWSLQPVTGQKPLGSPGHEGPTAILWGLLPSRVGAI